MPTPVDEEEFEKLKSEIDKKFAGKYVVIPATGVQSAMDKLRNNLTTGYLNPREENDALGRAQAVREILLNVFLLTNEDISDIVTDARQKAEEVKKRRVAR
jgi:hypothetical protein